MQESLSEVGDRKGLMGCGSLMEYPHPEGFWAITVKGPGLGWGRGQSVLVVPRVGCPPGKRCGLKEVLFPKPVGGREEVQHHRSHLAP